MEFSEIMLVRVCGGPLRNEFIRVGVRACDGCYQLAEPLHREYVLVQCNTARGAVSIQFCWQGHLWDAHERFPELPAGMEMDFCGRIVDALSADDLRRLDKCRKRSYK